MSEGDYHNLKTLVAGLDWLVGAVFGLIWIAIFLGVVVAVIFFLVSLLTW